jgi:predicted NAD/FAD-dependent oxidoreductase
VYELPDSCDVAVVGAGLSGLTAAYELRGLDVVVLEAEDQIGGRSQRVDLAGWPITSGGEGWYDPNPASPESKLLTELGVGCAPAGGPGMLHANGRILRLSSAERLAEDLGLSEEARPDFLHTFQRVRETTELLSRHPVDEELIPRLLGISAIDWLGPLHREVLNFYRRLVATELGIALEKSSAFLLCYCLPTFGGASTMWVEFQVPEGGGPTISRALTERLARPPITGALVTAIEDHGSRSVISYRRNAEEKSLNASFVIVATPPPVTAEIVRGLPPAKLAGIATIQVEPIIEVSLLLADGGAAPWDEISAMWAIDRSFSMCLHSKTDLVARVGDGGAAKRSVVKVQAIGPSAAPLVDRSDEFVVQLLTKDFVDVFPAARGKVEAHHIKRWMHAVPWPTLGYERHLAQLLEPVGNVHFAGDWVGFVNDSNPGGLGRDGDWGAYIVTVGLNAAVRAGMRAGSEVRARVPYARHAD